MSSKNSILKISWFKILSSFLLFALLLASPKSFAQAELNERDIDEIKTTSERRLVDLSNFISTMARRDASIDAKTTAFEGAVKLFLDKERVMQVSNKTKNSIKSFLIEAYFNRIKVLQYSRVDIKWADIYISGALLKGPDGRYYGSATLIQEFTGYLGDNISYTDKTKKTVEIVVEKLLKNDETVWNVYLGNILVEETI